MRCRQMLIDSAASVKAGRRTPGNGGGPSAGACRRESVLPPGAALLHSAVGGVLLRLGPRSAAPAVTFSGKQRLSAGARWSIAIAASLSLHLSAAALFAGFISSHHAHSSRLTAAPLIVRIGKMEQPAVPPASFRRQSLQNGEFPEAVSSSGRTPSSSRFVLRTRYFSAAELDVTPKIRREIELYPEELRGLAHDGGKTVLRLWIDETGRVLKAEPLSSGMPPVFTEAAARTFMQADFLPGMKDGLAVNSRVDAVLLYPPGDPNR